MKVLVPAALLRRSSVAPPSTMTPLPALPAAPVLARTRMPAFRRVDPELLLVARTLGASPLRLLFRVAVPLSWPGLLSGALVCWARALGEFGATIIFAGNMAGRTQTMPLAIYLGFETDLDVALTLEAALQSVGEISRGQRGWTPGEEKARSRV